MQPDFLTSHIATQKERPPTVLGSSFARLHAMH